MTSDLIERARGGDGEAFRQLVEPYRRELRVHCYRILGSAADAEDALQDTWLAAWQGLGGFAERSSLRTWLYRVATSRCLNMLRARSRRPWMDWPPAGTDPPEPTGLGEAPWIEPYPDVLLDGLADTAPGPEARYEAREAISLAFVTALQLLPPRQRAVLILRDVLAFPASEVASILGMTEGAVTSALKRARAAVERRLASGPEQAPPLAAGSPGEQELVGRLARAFEDGDIDGVVALLTDDVWLSMPPLPFEYRGREVAARFIAAAHKGQSFRVIATRANGQPAFALYVRDPQARVAHANGLLVLTLAGSRICAMTRFDVSVMSRFGFPRTLPD